MAIALTKYVNITSGVGAGAGVRQRDLILRAFTTNPLVPTGSMVEFTTLADVLAYFGSTAVEYLRASFYFGWISKNITRANKISFARWVDADAAPQIYGVAGGQSLTAWQAVTAGTFGLTLGSTTHTIGPLDFSAVTSLADVATELQTAIRAADAAALWASATVSYDATRGSFNLVGGATGAAAVAVTVGVSNDIAALLGWVGIGAILSDGAVTETITDTLTASANASNNFASFLFVPTLTQAQVVEAATWNAAQNNMFMFCARTTSANAASDSAALINYGGAALTLAPLSTEYPEQVPAMILAATDYSRRNSTQNYMYQEFALTPSVTDTTISNTYDGLRVNYYGQTQTAGQFVQFYQRGLLMGLATDATDQNTYANEIWFKDAAGAAIMTLLLSLSKVSANATGRSQLIATLQAGPIADALNNGTISLGKPLSTTQKLYIGQLTGDDLAWHQVQTAGYWLDCVIESYVTTDSRTEWKAVYTLIYSKDDTIRSVEGSHVLI